MREREREREKEIFGPHDRPPTHPPFSEIYRFLAFGLGLVVQFVGLFAVVLRTKNRV